MESASMPRFSLIVATVVRTQELSALLLSLSQQKMCDFELILVDQNTDDRLFPLLKTWAREDGSDENALKVKIDVKHLRCAPGLSRARNLGIQHAAGEILAFPDDDCWYGCNVLQDVHHWFLQNPTYHLLSLGSRDQHGMISGNRWPQKECDLNRLNVFRASATYTYFVRRPGSSVEVAFDETIGPGSGTPYGCGEDVDLLLVLMGKGLRGRFNSHLYIGHPRKDYLDQRRAEFYGGGFGGVLAKHALSATFCALLLFDFLRAALHLFCGNRRRALHLKAHGLGMVRAWVLRRTSGH
jgi:glycosyltransferase involved in cell wall biosynthesis